MTRREPKVNATIFALLAFLALALGLALAGHATVEGPDALLSRLEGGWYGERNPTPMGALPFSMVFERQADGSLHSRTSLNRETYVDLRFARGEDGRWMLHEEAGMEGLGVQAYTLAPAGGDEHGYRWVYEPEPDFLWVDVAVEGEGGEDTMAFDVRLRGEPHVAFRLARQAPEAVAELERQEEIQAGQSPEEGISMRQLAAAASAAETAETPETGTDADPIAAARAAVLRGPRSGEAHLALARALGMAINRDPANGPRYAGDMLTALETAIELEPELAEAYQWLAGYYLNAPPIAGGSLAKAEETARRLAPLDPTGAEELLREIEARRGDG